MSKKRDYYEVLGVDRQAGEKDLKNAFRRLARKYHPDRSTEDDAENRFKELQEAYAVLSDSENDLSMTDLDTMALKEIHLEGLVRVDSILISKIFLVGIFSPISSVEDVHAEGNAGVVTSCFAIPSNWLQFSPKPKRKWS